MRQSFNTYCMATTAIAIGLAAMSASAARAQDGQANATDSISEVVVTSYRNSLLNAETLKRQAVGAQDVILSQDIGAFPDLNLAESLQRIPGITISRDSGEGRQITLRGLGPDFTRTQLNGMEVLGNTASGMDNRGGVSRTRAFDYSLFASELFDKVIVQKSYASEQDEGGIGGTVELYTAKPFDYPGFKGLISAQGQDNTNASGVTPRVVGLLSNRWGDFGALVSVAYSEANSNEFGYRDFNWGPIHVNAANIGSGVSATDSARLQSTNTATEIYAPQADTYSTWYDKRKRLGTTLSLQYEPGTQLKLGFDALFSQLKDSRQDYVIAASGTNSLTGNITGTQVVQSDVIQGNSLVAASFTGVDLRTEENQEEDTTNFYQLGLHGSYAVNDKLNLRGFVGYSRSDYSLPVFDKVFLESQNHAFSFDYRPSMPVNTYGFNTTNPALWQLMRADTQENYISSQYTNGKFDADYAIDKSSKIQVGFAYKKFVNSGSQYNDKEFHNVPTDTIIPDNLKATVPYQTLANYTVGDLAQIYSLIGQNRNIATAKYAAPGTAYTVTEETKAAYIQYDLDTDLAGHRVRANAGVRYYTTDLTSAGLLNTGNTLSPVVIRHSYGDWLPALNVVDVVPNLIARFSANRDISRPALSDLAAAGSLTTAPFGGTISTGNPDLKPFLADEVEGSVEYYDHRIGFISVGVFYKNLESFITTQTTIEPYSQTGYPVSFLLPGQDGTISYNVSRPINGPGASIKGVEIAFQRDFDFLPGVLKHLGMVANATYADGSTPIYFSGVPITLPLANLSKYTANTTLYYETTRWGVRVSDAYRDKYLDGSGSNGNIGDFIAAQNNVDFDAHYNITPKLKLRFEAINLTNQHIVEYTDVTAKRLEVNTSAGQTFVFGASYEF